MPREFSSFNQLFIQMRQDVEHRLHNAEPILKGAGEIIKTHAQATLGHYMTEGGPFPGQPWKPLAASTLAQKAHDTPLVETGALHDAIEVHATHDEVLVGVKHEETNSHRPARGESGADIGDIAYYQEYGTLDKNGYIPPRPFLGPALHDNQKEIEEHIVAGLFVELSRNR